MPRRSPIFRNSPPSSHFVETCPCGAVVNWCRCHGPSARPPVVEMRESAEPCETCVGKSEPELYDLEWDEVESVKVPNPAPPVRPVTLALDLIEVKHQAGISSGKTRISPEVWGSIFYRGDASSASPAAKERAFERWKSAVRAFGFECSPSERGDEGRGTFCVSMARAIPWAERVLAESERRAEERRSRPRQTASRVVANSQGSLVRVRR